MVKELNEKIKRGETKCLGKGLLGKTSKTQLEVYFVADYGFSKGRKKSKKAERYPDAEKMHYEFQTNTIKSHRVLSFLFLGKQVIRHALERFKIYLMLKNIPYSVSDSN